MPASTASVKQDRPKHAPLITSGRIQPDTLRRFEQCALAYFRVKAIPAERWVATVAFNMEDPLAIDWLSVVGESLLKMEWDEYIVTLRSKWLKKDWEHVARRELLAMEQGTKSFEDFSFEFRSKNALLTNTSSQLDEQHMRHQLKANMDKDLAADCAVEKTYLIDDFNDWMDAVCALDEKRARHMALINREVARRSEKNRAFASNAAVTRTTSAATRKGLPSSSSDARPPKLTPKERELLSDHHGCYTCRHFYVYHISSDCPNGFPSGTNYTPLTLEMAKKAKAPRPVAAVNPTTSSSSAHIEEVSADTVPAVTAILPVPVCMTDEDDSSFNSDLNGRCAPLFTDHFLWPCTISNPRSSSSARVTCLIDHGSPVVLIKDALVSQLGLKRHALEEPFPLGGAFSGGKTDLNSFHYVYIRPVSVDSKFRSCNLKAIIAPSLCSDIICGGPFLASNQLVLDHAARTCISKLDNAVGYDLLNLDTIVPSPPQDVPPWPEKRPPAPGTTPALGGGKHAVSSWVRRCSTLWRNARHGSPPAIVHVDAWPSQPSRQGSTTSPFCRSSVEWMRR